MARMRSIKPEYWADQKLTLLPRDVRLLYVALWNFADEEGRMQGDTRLVKSWCFPLDDDVTAAVIDKWLGLLADAGKLVRYEVDGSDFLYLSKLSAHQKLDPRLESRHPAPPDPDSTPVHTNQPVRTGVENEGSPDPEGAKHVASSMLQEAGVRSGVDTPPAPNKRGRRIPEDWAPEEADHQWRRALGISDAAAKTQTEMFVDHFLAASGQSALKVEWSKAWRNWLRRYLEQAGQRRTAAPAVDNSWMSA